MLLGLFLELRKQGVPTKVVEWLDLMAVLRTGLVTADITAFYHLSRAVLVKDERYYDRFDYAFSDYLRQVEKYGTDWLNNMTEEEFFLAFDRELSPEEQAELQRLAEDKERLKTTSKQVFEIEDEQNVEKQGLGASGNKSASATGSAGFNIEEGMLNAESGEQKKKAVRAWDEHAFRSLDEKQNISSRNLQLALRPLRRFAREGAALEFDLEGTIRATARDGGFLNVQERPERRNHIKLLMLFDVSGSMDVHVKTCQELFSACRDQFKHLEFFYFHNCVYETLWKHPSRRDEDGIPTIQVLNTYGADYRVIFIGDAAMDHAEITRAGGSVEHWNEETGEVWLTRVAEHYRRLLWLNPNPERTWSMSPSTQLITTIINDRMFPLTIDGLKRGIQSLSR